MIRPRLPVVGSRRRPRRQVRMVPGELGPPGRRLHFSVSDNAVAGCGPGADGPGESLGPGEGTGTGPGENLGPREGTGTGPGENLGPREGTGTGPGDDPVWAVNIHGYFAGGGMYWRESAHLAEMLGWRVINPCLPGFGGSDPLPPDEVDIPSVAAAVTRLLDHLGVEQAVLLGHSMGGAVAIELAAADPRRTLGVVYRGGVATPGWRIRNGVVVAAVSPFSDELAGAVDLVAAVTLDLPDLLIGRSLSSTLRRLVPDARHNVRALGRILPVGTMLMELDMSDRVLAVRAAGIPVLPVWGCFDRVASARTAREFAAVSGCDVVWVPGGHSWMLPRPQGQADVLRHLDPGRRFVADALARRGPGPPPGVVPISAATRPRAASPRLSSTA